MACPCCFHPSKRSKTLTRSQVLCRLSTCLDTTIVLNFFTAYPNAENLTTCTCGKMGALAGKNQNKSGTNQWQIKFVEICIRFVLISPNEARSPLCKACLCCFHPSKRSKTLTRSQVLCRLLTCLDPTIVLNFFFTAYPNAENMTTRTWVSPANNSRDMQDLSWKSLFAFIFFN